MTLIYNTEPARLDLESYEGDIIDMDFFVNEFLTSLTCKGYYIQVNSAPVLGTPFFMFCLKMQVRRKDSLLLKDWNSCVSPSEIVIINPGEFNLFDDIPFAESGFFDYDLKCNNGSGYFTIMAGTWHVRKKITV